MNTIAANIDIICQEINDLSIKYTKPAAKLVAVSKTYPSEIIKIAYEHGQRYFGENYALELAQKSTELKQFKDIEWHFIGTIQSNKSKIIAETASWVHTLTKLSHASRLNQQRPKHLSPLQVLIEVNISNEPSKQGLINYEEIFNLATQLKDFNNLKLRGLMGMATTDANNSMIHEEFTQLNHYLQKLNCQGFNLDQLSMGMSRDYPIALECGSTLIRVGSKIFGKRNYVK